MALEGLTKITSIGLAGGIDITGITTTHGMQLSGITTGLAVSGVATFTDNVTVAGTLTYEDVSNIDSVGLITARKGIDVSGGATINQANVTGVSTFTGTIDANGGANIVGGSTLDQVNVTGVSTFGGVLKIPAVAGANTNADLPVLFQTAAGIIEGGSGLVYNPGGDVLSVNGNFINLNTFRGAGALGTLTCSNHSSTTGITVSNKIDIKTVDNVAGAFKLVEGSNEYITVDTTNSSEAIKFGTAGTERVRIDADGRLLQNGITAVGDYMHQMEGAGGTGKVPAILFKNGTASTDEIIGGWTAYNTTNQSASIYAKEESANDDAYLQFSTRATGGSLAERLRITSTGKVGIGTNPTYNLDIQDGTSARVAIDVTTGSDASIYMDGINADFAGSDYYSVKAQSSGEFAIFKAASERLRITSDGHIIAGGQGAQIAFNNVGNDAFGCVLEIDGSHTTDHHGMLSLVGKTDTDAGTAGKIQFINSQNSSGSSGSNAGSKLVAAIEGRITTSDSNAGDDSGGYLRFTTKAEAGGNAEAMRITSTGRIGIGNNNPDRTVNITSATGGNCDVEMKAANNTGWCQLVFSDSDAAYRGAVSYSHTNDFMALYTSGTEKLRIHSGGKVSLSTADDTYLEIPSDERCIVFDQGQKMITSNDGQGNFNLIGGKNHEAVHVSSDSGNSGIVQIQLDTDGADGNIQFGVGPTRGAGSYALFTNGFKLVHQSSGLNGLRYTTGSNSAPSGLSSEYVILNKGNCEDGSWNTDAEAIFKTLGDGGSISLTTNDGGGNCNVCFNCASEVADTTGSAWRIRADIDSANSHFYIQNDQSCNSGGATGMTNRLEISESGTFSGSSSNNISDVRLKKNIATITNATAKIKELKGRTFEWKEEARLESGTQYGFIAQEMETVVSDLVTDGTKSGLRSFDKDGNVLMDNYSVKDQIVEYSKGVNVDGVVPILVEALKEAIAKIETLETKVSNLES